MFSGSGVKGPYSSSTWQTTAGLPGSDGGRSSGPPAVGTGSAAENGPMPSAASLSSAASAPPGFEQSLPPLRQHGDEPDGAAVAQEQARPSPLGGTVSPAPQPMGMSQQMGMPQGLGQLQTGRGTVDQAAAVQAAAFDLPAASHALLQAVQQQQQQQQQQAAAIAAGQAYRAAVGSPTRLPTLAGGGSIPVPPASAFQMPIVSRSNISSPQGLGALAAAVSQGGFDSAHLAAAQLPVSRPEDRLLMPAGNAALAAALSQANPSAMYNIPAAAYESFAAAISQSSGTFSPPPVPRRSSSSAADEYHR